jgi:hypothetical protein
MRLLFRQSELDNAISRARKIRCDSTRPICNNCVRRSNACEYDEKPRRRGPDKRPGTRQRSCKKRPAEESTPPPKRKKATNEHLSEEGEEPQARDASESPPDPRTLNRYSTEFYHSSPYPDIHSHPSTSTSDLRISEPRSHSTVRQPLSPLLYSPVLMRITSSARAGHVSPAIIVCIRPRSLYKHSLFYQSDMIFSPHFQIIDAMGYPRLLHLNVNRRCGGIRYLDRIRECKEVVSSPQDIDRFC